MGLAGIHTPEGEVPAFVDPERGVVALRDVLSTPPVSLTGLLRAGTYDDVVAGARRAPASVFQDLDAVHFGPPLRHPRMIWGIGLNYREHAHDLSAPPPVEPASFIKADHTIVGPDDAIVIPPDIGVVTSEAELGLVIGTTCRDVGIEEALHHVWGVCPILDQTAETVLLRNPRFLTRSKNYETFFSFGPWITPLAEILEIYGSLEALTVSTVRNGVVHRTNTVDHMTFGPAELVSFHSKMMPLYPGDIISTGTPGAAVVRDGDIVECRIDGLPTLRNRVIAKAESV